MHEHARERQLLKGLIVIQWAEEFVSVGIADSPGCATEQLKEPALDIAPRLRR
jgi:hypothetical protein